MANDRAMNALCLAISQSEFSRISNCDSAKDEWEILKTTYEGTHLVKSLKLQILIIFSFWGNKDVRRWDMHSMIFMINLVKFVIPWLI